jgi:hypothetical protein
MTAGIIAGITGTVTIAPLSAFADKASVAGYYACTGTVGTCLATANLSTDTVTITSSGGTGAGPTFAWTRISGDVFTVTSAATAATNFTIACGRGLTKSAIYRCTVTRGAGSVTVDVTVTAQYAYAPDGSPAIGEEP